MKVTSKQGLRNLIVLMLVFQGLNTFCSRKIHPESSVLKSEKKSIYETTPDKIQIENKNEISEIYTDTIPDEIFIRDTLNFSDSISVTADNIIETARKYLGVPHCMGGTTMKCIDCSGLLLTVFAEYGIVLPHNAQEQSAFGEVIKVRKELIKGDLVFFCRSYKTNKFITHSGIYLGNNEFIHTSSRKGVTITSLSDPYWNARYVFGTRILK